MDERRKHAYRYMLYRAMLDIRPLAWLRLTNLLCWGREIRRVRRLGALADWLHNLALFSSLNFERFDEDWFWQEALSLKQRHPEFDLEEYQRVFERQLSEPTDV
jgi:hypothetical protein